MNEITLTDIELKVLKSILGIELYDYLTEDEVEIWFDLQKKINKYGN